MRRVAVLLFLVVVCPAFAAIPNAGDPKAYTEHQYRKDTLNFNLRTTAGAYKEVGQRDPKWDTQAITFLEGVSKYMSYAGVELVYSIPDVPTGTKLEEMGRAVVELGCKDPLILDMFCLILNDQFRASNDYAKRRELNTLVATVTDPLLDSKYPVYRSIGHLRRRINLMPAGNRTEREAQAKLEARFNDSLVAIARQAEYPGVDRRIYLARIMNEFDGWPIDRQRAFYESLQKVNADKWITSVIGGKYHIQAAWAARGGGWANSVTPDGWKKFADELAEARKCLEEAHRLQPTYPEAATTMITVEMGTPGAQQGAVRGWFERPQGPIRLSAGLQKLCLCNPAAMEWES